MREIKVGIFDFLKNNKKIEGDIAYFKLEDWWLSSFSEKERNYIESVYKPMGSDEYPLTKGKNTSTTQSIFGLFSGMVSWFQKKEDRYISHIIIKKAESLITNNSPILDIYFLYNAKIQTLYKDRDIIPNGLELAIEACSQQISYSKQASKEFLSQWTNANLPNPRGYQQLVIIKEKQQRYKEAIQICNQALSEGWSGNWEERIERCNKKLSK